MMFIVYKVVNKTDNYVVLTLHSEQHERDNVLMSFYFNGKTIYFSDVRQAEEFLQKKLEYMYETKTIIN